ncbi:SDR family NAD(P)-dependent oxidoreductase [Flammeovirgaceae bacterium SG7u.111]|nr:SDR family NAD(P)-dependent oxidoreductase [Flammeovirgaceae bacterium SG7u.132]WPO34485.1 SDR family NAD(P)-dependent oxidoreductase [Flammeovirgaceae bacterium SG7u.111]
MNLSGNTILISGGASGIGLAWAKAFAEKGNKVILLGRSQQKLEEVAKLGFHIIKCDLEVQEEIEAAVLELGNKYPNLNCLINNAGVQFNYSFSGTAIPFEKIRKEININLTGQIILTQLLIPLLNTQKQATIINTTSALGAFPKSNGLVYSAAKSGLRNFTIGLKNSLNSSSINVLEFIPPVTATPMTEGRKEAVLLPEDLIAEVLPQLQKDYRLLTTSKVRFFLWVAFLFPNLAYKILHKNL